MLVWNKVSSEMFCKSLFSENQKESIFEKRLIKMEISGRSFHNILHYLSEEVN